VLEQSLIALRQQEDGTMTARTGALCFIRGVIQ
jgi:hypothetical protein